MNRCLVSLLTVMIVGCGESTNSNTESGSVEELDGGGETTAVHHSAGGIDLEELKHSPLFHEFERLWKWIVIIKINKLCQLTLNPFQIAF